LEKGKGVIGGVTKRNEAELETFRQLIETRLEDLVAEDGLGQAGQKTVELDQQAVGRLSRMDALQNQAMAKANAARRQSERRRLLSALARMDEGEFGYCESCGDEIALKRLELDPAAIICVDCARG